MDVVSKKERKLSLSELCFQPSEKRRRKSAELYCHSADADGRRAATHSATYDSKQGSQAVFLSSLLSFFFPMIHFALVPMKRWMNENASNALTLYEDGEKNIINGTQGAIKQKAWPLWI